MPNGVGPLDFPRSAQDQARRRLASGYDKVLCQRKACMFLAASGRDASSWQRTGDEPTSGRHKSIIDSQQLESIKVASNTGLWAVWPSEAAQNPCSLSRRRFIPRSAFARQVRPRQLRAVSRRRGVECLLFCVNEFTMARDSVPAMAW